MCSKSLCGSFISFLYIGPPCLHTSSVCWMGLPSCSCSYSSLLLVVFHRAAVCFKAATSHHVGGQPRGSHSRVGVLGLPVACIGWQVQQHHLFLVHARGRTKSTGGGEGSTKQAKGKAARLVSERECSVAAAAPCSTSRARKRCSKQCRKATPG